ncbi:MAG TPA: hypothetical protein VK453_21605 [Micromonosporaceae bacterium]|nr:hypothetical protein [Micromonosporaceae bacterium]
MTPPFRVAAFGLALAAVFAASVGLGTLTGPGRPSIATHSAGDNHAGDNHADGPAAADSGGAPVPGGLQVAQDGYRMVPLTSALALGTAQPFRFQILGPDGAPVTRYTTNHDKDLHLIVARRDLSGYQHVHPTLDSAGTWSAPLAVAAPGQYRVFADFTPAGRNGLTLGVDVPAPGEYQPVPLPPPGRTATVAGYTVTLDGALVPGASATLTLTVSRDGAPVTDLQPYLGAYGHLVALRDGDLAYLHVHPDGAPGDGRTAAGPQVIFHAEVPSAGAYRLYLDFQHAGRVHTAEFTALAGTAPTTAPTPATATAEPPGHDQPGHDHG